MESQAEQPYCKSHHQEGREQDTHQGGGGHVGLVRNTGLDALQRGQEARTGISVSHDGT